MATGRMAGSCCGMHEAGVCDDDTGLGGGAGSVSVGDAIGLSTFNDLLYVDGAGKLAQNAGLAFNGTILTVPRVNAANQVRGGSGGTGTAAVPDIAVNGTDKGLWSPGANRLGFATAGVATWEISATGMLLAAADATFDIGATLATRPNNLFLAGVARVGDGTAAAPSVAFDSGGTSGLYKPGTTRLGFATAGVARWEMSAAGHLLAATDATFDIGAAGATRPNDIHLAGHLLAGDGTAAAPSVTFDSAGTGGLYKPGANRLGFATAGVARWEMSAAGHLIAATDATFDVGATGATRPRDVFASGHFLGGAGAAATPSLSFDGDPDTGLFDAGANRLGFATAGVARWEMDASGNLIATTDNTLDIGASGATRPRDVYLGGNIRCLASAAGLRLLNAHSVVGNANDISINAGNGVTDTMVKANGRLQAGTTTASSADVIANTINTRTAGWTFQAQNNTVRKLGLKFDGRLMLGVPNSAPTDADIQNNEVSFYLDEATPAFKARIRKSDGTYLTWTSTNGASPTLA